MEQCGPIIHYYYLTISAKDSSMRLVLFYCYFNIFSIVPTFVCHFIVTTSSKELVHLYTDTASNDVGTISHKQTILPFRAIRSNQRSDSHGCGHLRAWHHLLHCRVCTVDGHLVNACIAVIDTLAPCRLLTASYARW